MATYPGTVRRGLPRAPGGDPWPPSGDPWPLAAAPVDAEVPVVAVAAAAAGAAAAADAVPGPAHLTAVDERSRLVQPRATEGALSHQSGAEAGPTAVVDAAARPLRRGLPRVPGGEPWPAASTRPVVVEAAAGVTGSAALTDDRSRLVQPHPQEAARSHQTGAAAPRPTSSAPDSAAAAASGTALRRGLPRIAGGEAWPAAGSAPERPSVAAAVAATPNLDAPGGAPTSVERAEAPAAAAAVRRGLPRAGAAPAATGTIATTPDAPSGPRPPLPFTRTVWPGAAAASRPTAKTPKPEPTRIGPLTRAQWAGAVIVGGAGLLFAAGMVVLFTRWFISLEFMRDFLVTYPGETHLPEGAPVGIPAWLGWQHFFNTFLIVLIIRSGWQVRTEKRPGVFWSPRNNPKRKISLGLWFHQSLDILWIVNGVIFIVLLFATGQWMRVVPTSWEVIPNAFSAALQYVSLDWPTENGWVNYNSLQVLAYFVTIFIAAPLAIATGVRMSGIWPSRAKTLSRAYPVEWARAIHFPVMLYFVLFIIVHVTLVFATGALRNLNHMYGGQDAVNWVGFWIFFASLVVIIIGWIAARPLVLAPIARLFGRVSGR